MYLKYLGQIPYLRDIGLSERERVWGLRVWGLGFKGLRFSPKP